MNTIHFTITPAEFCRQRGWQTREKRGQIQAKYCPFCSGGRSRTKWSFSLNAIHGAFSCFKGSCPAREGGSFWQLLETAGLDPKDFIDRDASPARRSNRSQVSQRETDMTFKRNHNFAHNAQTSGAQFVGGSQTKQFKAPYTPVRPLTAECRTYLEGERLIDAATLTHWRVGSTPDGNIIMPFFESRNAAGEPASHVLSKHRLAREPRQGEPKAKRDADGKAILYGTWLCDPAGGNLTITEGELDAMTLSMAGVENVVSLPSGTNDHDFIDLQWQWLDQWESITLWMDNDDAGRRALHELAKRLRRDRCRQVVVRYKDANDMLRAIAEQRGLDAALAEIKAAVDGAREYQLEDLVDLADEHEEDAPDDDDFLVTRWGALDAATRGIHPGDFYLIFGDNGSGKSTAMGNLLCEQLEAGGKVMLYSGEMSIGETRDWVDRMLAGPSNIEARYHKETGATDYVPKSDVVGRIRNWYRGRVWFYKRFGALDFDAFFDAAEYAVRRYGIKMIIIDSLTTAIPDDDYDKYSKQGALAGRARQFADEFGVSVFLMMHVTAESLRDGGDQRPPTKAALRGAHAVADWATHIIGCWRVPDEVKNRKPVEASGRSRAKENFFYKTDNVLVLLKNRTRGELVTARMGFDETSKRLYLQSTPAQANRPYGWATDAPVAAVPTATPAPLPEPLAITAPPEVEPVIAATSAELEPGSVEDWERIAETMRAAGELPPPHREPTWVGEIPF